MRAQSFTQLVVWQKAHRLVLEVYKATRDFPLGERWALVDQLRRASISITSNIAEGFNRKTSKDKSHFYITSIGSLAEVQSQLLLARDLGYIHGSRFQSLASSSVEVHKMLNGLIRSVQKAS